MNCFCSMNEQLLHSVGSAGCRGCLQKASISPLSQPKCAGPSAGPAKASGCFEVTDFEGNRPWGQSVPAQRGIEGHGSYRLLLPNFCNSAISAHPFTKELFGCEVSLCVTQHVTPSWGGEDISHRGTNDTGAFLFLPAYSPATHKHKNTNQTDWIFYFFFFFLIGIKRIAPSDTGHL